MVSKTHTYTHFYFIDHIFLFFFCVSECVSVEVNYRYVFFLTVSIYHSNNIEMEEQFIISKSLFNPTAH